MQVTKKGNDVTAKSRYNFTNFVPTIFIHRTPSLFSFVLEYQIHTNFVLEYQIHTINPYINELMSPKLLYVLV